MSPSAYALVALSAGLLACVDFGYALPPPPPTLPDASHVELDATPADAVTSASLDGSTMPSPDTAEAEPPCVESMVSPSDVGPQIRMQSLSVDRPAIEIAPGDVVTWTNADTMDHTATAGAPGGEIPTERGGFASPLMASGDRFAFRFCAPRQLLWFCRTHPAQMRDYRIVVR